MANRSRKAPQKPSKLQERIITLLLEHPEGLSDEEMQAQLGVRQNQFQRRRRDIKQWYEMESANVGGRFVHRIKGIRATPLDAEPIDAKLRAEVLMRAHGRCQMCGRTIEKHDITLDVDHRVPRTWGGKTEISNLWALCEPCNQGKKDFFESFDPDLMRRLTAYASVHIRIGETLLAMPDRSAPSYLIEAIANQTDWRKRLRDLRYLGWEIRAKRTGKSDVVYILERAVPWTGIKYPNDPTRAIREYERDRLRLNKDRR